MLVVAVPIRIVAWSVVALLGSGCADRVRLDRGIVDEIDQQVAWDYIRVYPSRRIRRPDPKQNITRKTVGAIVGRDRVDGAERLWVTFDRHCYEPECAFAFIEDEDGTYTFAGDLEIKLDIRRHRTSRDPIRYERPNATSGA